MYDRKFSRQAKNFLSERKIIFLFRQDFSYNSGAVVHFSIVTKEQDQYMCFKRVNELPQECS